MNWFLPKRVCHVKRGSTYDVLGVAEVQIAVGSVDLGEDGSIANARIAQEGDRLVVYRDEDGKLWCRFEDEFNDGRFEVVEAARAPQMPSDVAALVERLEKCHEYIEKNAANESVDPEDVRQWGTIYSEAASALQAQAAEIMRLQAKVLSLEVELSESVPAHKWQRVKTDAEKFKDQVIDTCKRAEAAEAKLRESVEVVRDIATSDDIDNMLDPERNKRVARAFHASLEPVNE